MDVNEHGENPILHRGNRLRVVHFTVGSLMMSFLKMFWNGLLAAMNINTMDIDVYWPIKNIMFS